MEENTPLLSSNNELALTWLTENISGLVNRLAQFKKHLNMIGTNKDTANLRDALQRQNNEITVHVKTISDGFKKNKDPNPADKPKYQKLLSTFSDLVKQFKSLSEEYHKKERSSIPIASADGHRDDQYDDLSQKLMEIDPIQHDEALIIERNQGMKEVTNDLLALQEMFQDMAQMVGDQGEAINIVEDTIANVDYDVEIATQDLRDASDLQTSASKKKVWIFVTIACGLVLLLIILSVVFGLWKEIGL